jgi:hypothetical protein
MTCPDGMNAVAMTCVQSQTVHATNFDGQNNFAKYVTNCGKAKEKNFGNLFSLLFFSVYIR